MHHKKVSRLARGTKSRRKTFSSLGGESNQRLRAILETAVEGIITIDEAGIIESVNRAAQRIFGYSAVELVGKSINILMPQPDRSSHDGHIANYLRTGCARIIGIGREVTGLHKDGTAFPMDLAVSEVRLASRRLFTGFVRDITERKRLEAEIAEMADALAEKNRQLESIVYTASHDLRSPLVNLVGFANELARACETVRQLVAQDSPSGRSQAEALLTKDIPESIQFINTSARRVDSLLSGFLRFSRLGNTVLKLEHLDMDQLVGDIVRTMDFQIRQSRATVDVRELPRCIGDATQLAQVFCNLLDNALKYLDPDRAGRIEISGRVERDRSIFAVADNGIGIPEDQQARAFEIFQRLERGRVGGEGLGLTIARRILERHDGNIWMQSVPGKGSTFFLSLPSKV